jgi:hypothetical protein
MARSQYRSTDAAVALGEYGSADAAVSLVTSETFPH